MADDIATQNHFSKKLVNGGDFTFTVYERIIDRDLPFAFYLEKDGYIMDKYAVSENPTPTQQMLFHLAALDKKRNVVLIARPCQYTDLKLDKNCATSIYWNQKRLAKEVITATNDVMNLYTDKPFTAIGHSGGGSIAVLVATINKNVKEIITIAANLDIIAFNDLHKSAHMTGSLNPIDYAKELTSIPQLHLAGAKDDRVPPFLIKKYVAASNSPCVKERIISEATHNKGWEKIWPSIISAPINCQSK